MTAGTTHQTDTRIEPVQPDAAPRLRASDADRAATVAIVEDAVARGLLTHDEGGERMAAAFAARFTDELPAVTADLPPIAGPTAVTAAGWRSLGSTLTAQVRHEISAAAAAGPGSRRFLVTALVAVLMLGILVGLGAVAVHGLADGGIGHQFPVDGR
jgi:hypothetical protein